jgi:hypothetical protein
VSGPDWVDWETDVRDNLIPKLTNSGAVAMLVPRGESDVKFAVELGLSIMLDKPIVALVRPGTTLPPKLAAIADRVVIYDVGSPSARDAIGDAIMSVLNERGQR